MANPLRLIVVGTTEPTLRYALSEARDARAEFGRPVELLVLVDPTAVGTVEDSTETLDVPQGVTVRFVAVGDALAGVRERAPAAEQILVSPDSLSVEAVRAAVETPVELVPAGRVTRQRRLRRRLTARRFTGTFVLAYAFYLLLGDPFDPFDLVTGAAAAGVVAATLAPVVFETEPTAGRTLPRIARATVFVPYLLYAVVRANVAIAAVILHPSLPIDPETVRLQPAVEDRFGRAVLANAITLTPGTLTVDVDESGFLVHSLTSASRADLDGGPLERAVRFVFEGGGL